MTCTDDVSASTGFPKIGREELFRFFTPAPADVAFVDRGRGPAGRLGLSVALCTLPWLGFVPDDVAACACGVEAGVMPQTVRGRHGSCSCASHTSSGSSARTR
ncbi:DUF4158 domain-containing protein [Saccharothrix ecbatanensis]|uniref:DUF4158 domain-containing protein n=1 Tax=Saccharothrix ecbatanensis TaxID=1105145 RepID=UPI0024837634|nr:DUF4158 domain-containing protein [Saccharothrix ecbatanensis]